MASNRMPSRHPVWGIGAVVVTVASVAAIMYLGDRSGVPMRELIDRAWWRGILIFLMAMAYAVPKDMARQRVRREGLRLRGPEKVDTYEFNDRMREEGQAGLVFVGEPVRRFLRKPRPDAVFIPRGIEAQHVMVMGDTGSGKSAIMRQIQMQLGERGERAIVYDPALEYTPRFYEPDRGDIILNPLDARMPYWSPGDEITHEAETATLAESVFPDRPRENRFFTEAPRKIFARLLEYRPTAAELAHWLSHEEEIDKRVRGTALETMVHPGAPAQRAGVLSSLSMVADAVKLLPQRPEGRARWSAVEWSRNPKGWIFVTSTHQTRPALLPLTSWWLDSLVLRLMSQGRQEKPIWFVLDELHLLQRLPQLHTALTENRKSGNPVVVGFQGRAQLEGRYGDDAEVMLSQPRTKIFLCTGEPRAAEWISKCIGEVEIERIRETHTASSGVNSRSSRSEVTERKIEPLVMASEVSGLPKLRGYMKVGNLVVERTVRYFDPPEKQPGFIPREKEPPVIEARPVPAALPAPPSSSAPLPAIAAEPAPRYLPIPATGAPEPAPSPAPAVTNEPEPFFE